MFLCFNCEMAVISLRNTALFFSFPIRNFSATLVLDSECIPVAIPLKTSPKLPDPNCK